MRWLQRVVWAAISAWWYFRSVATERDLSIPHYDASRDECPACAPTRRFEEKREAALRRMPR